MSLALSYVSCGPQPLVASVRRNFKLLWLPPSSLSQGGVHQQSSCGSLYSKTDCLMDLPETQLGECHSIIPKPQCTSSELSPSSGTKVSTRENQLTFPTGLPYSWQVVLEPGVCSPFTFVQVGSLLCYLSTLRSRTQRPGEGLVKPFVLKKNDTSIKTCSPRNTKDLLYNNHKKYNSVFNSSSFSSYQIFLEQNSTSSCRNHNS